MAQITAIDLGTIPNDGTGDVLRFGGQIINDNFAELNVKKLEAGTFIGTATDLDGRIANIESDYATLSTAQTFTGVKTFNSLPVSSVVPTLAFQFTNKDYVDNAIANISGYEFWNLKTNGVQRTTIQDNGVLDLVEGDGIKLSYSAGGVVEIAFINDDLGFITDAPNDGNFYGRQNGAWVQAQNTIPTLQQVLDTGNTSTTNAQFLEDAKLQLTNDSTFTSLVTDSDSKIEVARKINLIGSFNRFSGVTSYMQLDAETTERAIIYGTRNISNLNTISDDNFAVGNYNQVDNANTGIPYRLIATQANVVYAPPTTNSTSKVNLIGGFNSFIEITNTDLGLLDPNRQEIDDIIGNFVYVWNKSEDVRIQDITGVWSVVRSDKGEQLTAIGINSNIYTVGGSLFTQGGAFYNADDLFFDVSYAQTNPDWYVFRSNVDVQSVFSGTIQAKSFLISSDDNDPFDGGNGFYATLNAGTLTDLRNYTFQDANGIVAFLSDTLGDAPNDGLQYARQNESWTAIQASQTVINSTDTIEVTINNGEYELNAIGVANYSEWAQYTTLGLKQISIGFDTINTIKIIENVGAFITAQQTLIKSNTLDIGDSNDNCLSRFYGGIEIYGDNNYLRFKPDSENQTTLLPDNTGDANTVYLPSNNGTLALLSEVVQEAPLDATQYVRYNGAWRELEETVTNPPFDGQNYVRKNDTWVLLPSGGQTTINSTDTIQATLDNDVYTLDAIGSANYSEWAQYFGTRGDGNLNVQIGDFDSSNNNTYIDIVDATGFIDLNATQGKVNLNAPLITALGNLELFFTNLQFRGSGITTITKSGTGTNTINLPNSSGTFALLSDIVAGIGEAPNDGKQYARQNESWQQVITSGDSFEYITETLDVNNDFFITIGDFNTSGIEVQNQSGFNYIQLGNFNFDSRLDISTTDVRIGDQFGLQTGTLFQMFSSSIAINVQSGLRLESGFNTQGVNLKLNAIASNNKYDCFFPQKIGNQTIAMMSDLDAVGAQSKSFTITDPINEVIPLFILGDSISIKDINVSRLGSNDLIYKLGYGNTLDAIDQDIGGTETVSNNGSNVLSLSEGVPANNFVFLDIIDNGSATQFHITINYE